MDRILKLGTRRSLLAMAQSQWVAKEVEKTNPGVRVELVGIETRGDQILDIPLSQVEGKEFFVAELDESLMHGRVDFTVHSMKDLSLERAKSIVCAAIPQRENPRDVILFSPHVMKKLDQGEVLKIGTSSPRRIENIPPFLNRVLPRPQGTGLEPRTEFVEIRGNVNTRLRRVTEPIDSDRYLDGVVLAFAGLIRLWADAQGRSELEQIMAGLRWMVLPLKECPTAPAQAALAIECRSDNTEVRAILKKIHHVRTEQLVARERSLLAQWGGGCHQKFGATALGSEELGELFYVRGQMPTGEFVERLDWPMPPAPLAPQVGSIRPWDGHEWRKGSACEMLSPPTFGQRTVFLGHSRAAQHAEVIKQLKNCRVWVSGVKSWEELAEQGIWVEGCAENLGFESLVSTLQEGVLGLPRLLDWLVLTHRGAVEGWRKKGMQAVATYKLNSNSRAGYDEEAKKALRQATDVFWSSGSQYNELKEELSSIDLAKNLSKVRHACGPGKTAEYLRNCGLKPIIFPSVEEWKQWIRD